MNPNVCGTRSNVGVRVAHPNLRDDYKINIRKANEDFGAAISKEENKKRDYRH